MKKELIKQFLDRKNIFAVLGASNDAEKYGHLVYKDLRAAGYEVYPVNPNAEEVLGDKCYPDLRKLPKIPDVVDIVVPPKVAEEIVKICRKLGIMKVWMQPGSESEAAIKFWDDNGMDLVHGVCIMI